LGAGAFVSASAFVGGRADKAFVDNVAPAADAAAADVREKADFFSGDAFCGDAVV